MQLPVQTVSLEHQGVSMLTSVDVNIILHIQLKILVKFLMFSIQIRKYCIKILVFCQETLGRPN